MPKLVISTASHRPTSLQHLLQGLKERIAELREQGTPESEIYEDAELVLKAGGTQMHSLADDVASPKRGSQSSQPRLSQGFFYSAFLNKGSCVGL